MSTDWSGIVLDAGSPEMAWTEIFSSLLALAGSSSSPVALHDATVVPDRLLTEAAWELWEAFPEHAVKTSDNLKSWTTGSDKAVLILDALSLRELPILMGAAEARSIQPIQVKVTGSECPSTTDYFARSLGLSSRSALANDNKPGTFKLFGGMLKGLALTMQRLEKASSENVKREEEIRKKALAEAADIAGTTAKLAGISDETIKVIRRDVLRMAE